MDSARVPAARLVERLIGDHRDIEAAASDVQTLVQRGDTIAALVGLGELHRKIVRHNGLDENVLFPLLARDLPDIGERLIYVVRLHRSSGQTRRRLQLRLLAGDGDGARRDAIELTTLLSGNHAAEELTVYGALEQLLARHVHL